MKFIFDMQINVKVFYKFVIILSVHNQACPKYIKVSKIASLEHLYNILKKKFESKLIFCILINIKVSYKLILSDTIVIDGHSHSFQSDKFTVSLNSSKKKFWIEFIFCILINFKVSASGHY